MDVVDSSTGHPSSFIFGGKKNKEAVNSPAGCHLGLHFIREDNGEIS